MRVAEAGFSGGVETVRRYPYTSLCNQIKEVSMDTKTKRRTPPREPSSHRLIDEKRTIIETLRKEGRSLSSIEARFTGLTETDILPINH